jgi:hypothetical protein
MVTIHMETTFVPTPTQLEFYLPSPRSGLEVTKTFELLTITVKVLFHENGKGPYYPHNI